MAQGRTLCSPIIAYAPLPSVGEGLGRRGLHLKQQRQAAKLEPCPILNRRRHIWIDPHAIDLGVIGAVQIGE